MTRPGGTILHVAHQVLESLVLDGETMHYKNHRRKVRRDGYYGRWFTPLSEALDAFVKVTQQNVTVACGSAYKGSCTLAGANRTIASIARITPHWAETCTGHRKRGFINLYGLSMKCARCYEKEGAAKAN
jgi:argininosuccinate synthase